MSRVDVLLISDDRHLTELAGRRQPPGAVLRCASPQAVTKELLVSTAQLWIDIDANPVIAPDLVRGRPVYFYSQLPAEHGSRPDGIPVRKPCSPSVMDVLWAGAVSEREMPRPDPAHPLPDWLLDFHELDLKRLCRRCVGELAARLGYRDASLYLFDSNRGLLTLAETTHRRSIDLTVPLRDGEGRLMVATALAGRLLHTEHAQQELRARGLPAHPERGYRDDKCLIAPLVSEGRLWGVLNFSGRIRTRVTELGLPLASVFAFLARSLHHACVYEQARTEARVDSLTGLYNQRWMQEALGKEIRRAQRFNSPLSVLMVDLDGLKAVNDRQGHAAGDCLLRHIAGRIGGVLRQFDGAARVGGDEFVIMLPGTTLIGARQVARRLLDSIRENTALYQDAPLPISASVGIAEWRPDWDARQLLEAADRAMYTAKCSGRDKLAWAPPGTVRLGGPEASTAGRPAGGRRGRSPPEPTSGALTAGVPRRVRGSH